MGDQIGTPRGNSAGHATPHLGFNFGLIFGTWVLCIELNLNFGVGGDRGCHCRSCGWCRWRCLEWSQGWLLENAPQKRQ